MEEKVKRYLKNNTKPNMIYQIYVYGDISTFHVRSSIKKFYLKNREAEKISHYRCVKLRNEYTREIYFHSSRRINAMCSRTFKRCIRIQVNEETKIFRQFSCFYFFIIITRWTNNDISLSISWVFSLFFSR